MCIEKKRNESVLPKPNNVTCKIMNNHVSYYRVVSEKAPDCLYFRALGRCSSNTCGHNIRPRAQMKAED
jgi:hypothetical protein